EIAHICREPDRFEMNATERLLGDHVGELSLTRFAGVSCRSLDTSTLKSHRLVVALFVSGSQTRTVKTTHCPSGDGTGLPTPCMRTMSWTPNACGFDKSSGEEGVGNDCPLADKASAATAMKAKTDRMNVLRVRRWAQPKLT